MLDIDEERTDRLMEAFEFQRVAADSDDRVTLVSSGSKQCRFCGGRPGQVIDGSQTTFKKDAHVIPQLLGNSNLVSLFECDSCNEDIFSIYESSLGAYTLPFRGLLGIRGQHGFPAYKNMKTDLRIQQKGEEIEIEGYAENEEVDIDQSENRMVIETPRPTYRPLHVFKAIAKIAFCLLGESELSDFGMYRTLLLSDNHDQRIEGHPLFRLFGYFLPGVPLFQDPVAMLFSRREDVDPLKHPAKLFYLEFANQIWQIPIASDDDDRRVAEAGGSVSMSTPQFPVTVNSNYFEEFGPYGSFTDDLSSREQRRNDHFETTFSFKSLER